MIGLDTNVLVRYLVQDEPAQFRRAKQFIEQHLTERDPGFVSVVTVVETAWVLERVYEVTDAALCAAIEGLLQADTLVVESEQAVFTAMVALRKGLGSFPDALIGALGRQAGCSHTVSFDRRALRPGGFALL